MQHHCKEHAVTLHWVSFSIGSSEQPEDMMQEKVTKQCLHRFITFSIIYHLNLYNYLPVQDFVLKAVNIQTIFSCSFR